MLTVISISIYAVESLIPLPILLPGIKLGFSNIITLITAVKLKKSDSFAVLLTKIFLSAILFGSPLSLFYSFSGGIFCLITMRYANKIFKGNYLFATSIFGAAAHNLGQIIAAIIITREPAVISYLPPLTAAAVLTGTVNGLAAQAALNKLKFLKGDFFHEA